MVSVIDRLQKLYSRYRYRPADEVRDATSDSESSSDVDMEEEPFPSASHNVLSFFFADLNGGCRILNTCITRVHFYSDRLLSGQKIGELLTRRCFINFYLYI